MNFVRKYRMIFAIGLAVLVIGLVVSAGALFLRADPVISSDIKRQIKYPIFTPSTSVAIVSKDTVMYNADSKQLSFESTTTETGSKLIVSMQPTPESFNDIPQVYEKLIEKMHSYTSFDSLNGKVFLTKPDELKGGQAAVMNSKGTLMFVRSDTELSDEQWRNYFNGMQINA